MHRWIRPALALALVAACSSSNADAVATGTPASSHADAQQPGDAPAHAAAKPAPSGQEAQAYFAGGCFWGVEYFLEKIDGVYGVESGYMGGHIENPSYAQVTSHQSGHLETVRVRYDPARVTYEALAKRFFEIHDPTQANGQGPDIGPQYLSAIFVANDQERAAVEDLIGQLKGRGYKVVTEIKPMAPFYEAEDYHQDYYERKEKLPYCHAPVNRFGDS